ncbi:MAG: NUDIX hydrolase [Synechococcales cyanobacterium RM1_1_8]|nr:NUDIX hydrolase [Synechococcales cyanobacterium RM1_1_8]
MKFNNRQNRCITVEGEEVWISRSVTVLPVLIFVLDGLGNALASGNLALSNAYVPLGQRGLDLPDEVGKWGLPGGYLDYDETAGEAVQREIWEELGLNIPALQAAHRFIGQLDQPYFVSSQPLRRQNVTLRFPLLFVLGPGERLPQLDPQVGKGEVEQARWFGLAEALAMDLAFGHEVVMADCLAGYFSDQGIQLL